MVEVIHRMSLKGKTNLGYEYQAPKQEELSISTYTWRT
jgi:hypothetical protein